jgi:hypothetical protein
MLLIEGNHCVYSIWPGKDQDNITIKKSRIRKSQIMNLEIERWRSERWYLLIEIGSPKPSKGTIIRIRGEDGRSRRPNLINVLHYHKRFTNGLAIMNQNWDFLMDRI